MAKIISIMQDGLEKFVNDNRKAFDIHQPNPNLWANIEAQLGEIEPTDKIVPLFAVESSLQQTTKVRSIRSRYLRYASVAAVGLLLLAIGGVIGSQFSNGFSHSNSPAIELSDISDEYAETEAYYASQVNSNIEKLKKLNYDESILDDIEELDEAFQELKRELGASSAFSDEEIIKAMIENYQMKIEILERVLERLSGDIEGDEINKLRSNEKINM